MAGWNTRSVGGAITGINVTPLVDITLVLLVVFMVTAKLIVSHSALQLDLPKAATGSEVQEILSIAIAADGTTQVDGTTVSIDDEILRRARSSFAKNRDLRAVIRADGDVPHRRVMRVLDLLRLAGVSKIGFGVTPLPSASATEP
jgi:biopolymer transport protein ExbD